MAAVVEGEVPTAAIKVSITLDSEVTQPSPFQLSLDQVIKIGRASSNDIVVNKPGVSNQHLQLKVVSAGSNGKSEPKLVLVDNSVNGTSLKPPQGSTERVPKNEDVVIAHDSILVIPTRIKAQGQGDGDLRQRLRIGLMTTGSGTQVPRTPPRQAPLSLIPRTPPRTPPRGDAVASPEALGRSHRPVPPMPRARPSADDVIQEALRDGLRARSRSPPRRQAPPKFVEVKKIGDHQKLGINLDVLTFRGRPALRIASVDEQGLMKDWNDQHPDSPVLPEDVIISVNGVQGSGNGPPSEMVDVIKTKPELKLEIHRPAPGEAAQRPAAPSEHVAPPPPHPAAQQLAPAPLSTVPKTKSVAAVPPDLSTPRQPQAMAQQSMMMGMAQAPLSTVPKSKPPVCATPDLATQQYWMLLQQQQQQQQYALLQQTMLLNMARAFSSS